MFRIFEKDVRLNINSRHLGLLQADEITDLNEKKERFNR